jgi:transposase
MSDAVLTRTPDAAELAALDLPPVVQQVLRAQAAQIEALRAQLEWFKRQLFGQKSERFAPLPDAQQMHLGELMPAVPTAPEAQQDVPAHKRRKARSDFTDEGAGAPFFDESKVPCAR